MTGAYAQNWPGRGAWASRGAGFTAEWSERESQSGPARPDREGRDLGERGERRGRKGHRHHHHHRDAANWLFSRGGGGGRHGGRPSPEELEQLIAWRRMGGGPFGGPGGPFGRGGGRGPGGRGRARRGDVRLALLRLLAEQPANGYQLMQTIEERSDGRWRPSPGSVYPTLAQLEDEGLIKSVEADGSRRFEITDAGREHLETRVEEPEPWKPADQEGENAITELAPLVIQIGKAAWQVATVGDEAQRARAIEVLAETRRSLYRILAEDAPETEDAEDAEDADASGESQA
jgi:DNA-binding PadR family transcriptional regulator